MNNLYINFSEMLAKRQKQTGSLVCIGLDPLPEKLPKHLNSQSPYQAALGADVAIWMMGIVDAANPYASMYKIQRAHWEALPSGTEALQLLIRYIKNKYPDIPVFLDCKRGDIGRTQARYRVAHLEIDGADGMNFSPYMGKDCLEYLLENSDLNHDYVNQDNEYGLVSLCYTSNSSGREVQDVKLADGRPYWEFIAETILGWTSELRNEERIGLVMAAAYEYPKGSGQVYSEHLRRCREIVGDKLWFLIPGVGTQKGYIAETVKAGWAGWGSMVISSSSDIIFASSGLDYQEAAAERAKKLYLDIQSTLKEMAIKMVTIDQALIVKDDPIATLKNCQGYYESPKDENGNYIGPLVGYAKKYHNEDGLEKNMVGFIYLNFAKAEEYPAVRSWFAKNIIYHMNTLGIKPNCILGAPMGGLFLTTDIGRQLKCRTIFAEKVVTVANNKQAGVREVSSMSLQRHGLLPGEQVVIVEDVVNNFSSAEKLISLVEATGAKVVAILAAFNRSGVGVLDYTRPIPVISVSSVKLAQYTQEDPVVSNLVAAGNLILKPKLEWEKLEAAMTKKV